jgi:hypothetical protein
VGVEEKALHLATRWAHREKTSFQNTDIVPEKHRSLGEEIGKFRKLVMGYPPGVPINEKEPGPIAARRWGLRDEFLGQRVIKKLGVQRLTFST